MRAGLRAAVSFVFGVWAAVNGMQHVLHLATDDAAASDLTGVLATVAGVVLLMLAVAVPFLHRGEGASTRRRRWIGRIVAVAGLALLGYVLVMPVAVAIVQTHKYREEIPAAPSR